MAKKKSSDHEQPIGTEADEQQEFFDVAEVDDASFDDDWDDDADMGDNWDVPATPKGKKKAPKKAAPVVEEDFGDESFGEEDDQSSVQSGVDPLSDGEVYDVPEGHIEEQEVYDVPEGEIAEEFEEDDGEPVVEVPESSNISNEWPDDEVPDVAQPALEAEVSNEDWPVEDVDVVEPSAIQEFEEPTQDVVEEVAESVDAEAQVTAEDIELPPEEEVKSDEEREREEQELEQYRSMMGESNAEMADVSEYRNYRRKTKTENKSSKPKKSDFDLFANRYKVKTMNATVAATDPIVYFYNACLRANGTIMMFNVFQVLQDRFLGKMVPQLFTAVAEASNKIDELNEANVLTQVKVCAEFPQYLFIVSISAHAFTKPSILERLLKIIPEEGLPNLVMAFDCSALQSIANAAKAGLSTIRARGVKVLLDNTERVSMDVLSEMEYDYMRIDARYYEMDNPRAEAYLRLVLSFAKEQGIGTIATFCDTEDMADYMLFMGVDAVQGNAISRPMRTVPNSVRAITLLPSMLDTD